MQLSWALFIVISCTVCSPAAQAVPWRDRRDYPKDFDHFEVYITKETLPVTGEQAMTDGCGRNGRPYKYRGKARVTQLRKVLEGVTSKVWVGAVDTTTPWTWSDGRPLFQLMGLTSSEGYRAKAVRIPGNNVFLCSLQCRQVAFILLHGNRCACSRTNPEVLPTSEKNLRCPGTFDDFCGTASTFTVYKNLLAETVQWSNLVTKSQYYGTRAYLYRLPQAEDPEVQLMAEVDFAAKKGYICNGTVFNIGQIQGEHLYVEHVPGAALTWRNAQRACMNKGRQLMMISRDAKNCVPEVAEELKKGQSYWVGLFRQNASLWLDGTAVKTTVSYHHHGQSACLTMTLTDRSPTFTFESCTGSKLQVLCEKDTRIHLQTFTHDATGNHVTTHRSSNENDYSNIVAILTGVLVVLSLLSVILVVFLCNRNKWIPKKTPAQTKKKVLPGGGAAAESNPTDNLSQTVNRTSGNKDHTFLRNNPEISEETCARDAMGYAIVCKGKHTRSPPSRIHNPLPNSGSGGYEEAVCFSESRCDEFRQSVGVNDLPVMSPQSGQHQGHPDPWGQKGERSSSVKIVDCRVDSSQSSITGSDDAYSVLSYRKAIHKAWTGLKRTAYAHVMVSRPKRNGSGEAATDDESSVYDVARAVTPRVRCIDNDYDHAEPRLERPVQADPQAVRVVVLGTRRSSESEV